MLLTEGDDLGILEVHRVHLLAIAAGLLLPQQRQVLAGGIGGFQVPGEIEGGLGEPGLRRETCHRLAGGAGGGGQKGRHAECAYPGHNLPPPDIHDEILESDRELLPSAVTSLGHRQSTPPGRGVRA